MRVFGWKFSVTRGSTPIIDESVTVAILERLAAVEKRAEANRRKIYRSDDISGEGLAAPVPPAASPSPAISELRPGQDLTFLLNQAGGNHHG